MIGTKKHQQLSKKAPHADDKKQPPQQGVSTHVGARTEAEPIAAGAHAELPTSAIKEKPLSPEVQKYIEQHEQKITVPQALSDLGITAGQDEQLQVPQGPQMPLSDERIMYGLHQPVNTSIRWLATLLLYILQQSHYTIKEVKGHAQRVLKP